MKGICFKDPLFHATIDGRKTQTRRIIKHAGNKMHHGQLLCHWWLSQPPRFDEKANEWIWHLQTDVDDSCDYKMPSPRYKVGEIVYLKEPYFDCQNVEGLYYDLYKYAGHELPYTNSKWGNKLFMSADKARYFIKITAVRVERLQEISEEDCFNEGIIGIAGTVGPAYKVIRDAKSFPTPREAYAALTDKINGKGTWDSNAWVWVYDYELCESVKPKE